MVDVGGRVIGSFPLITWRQAYSVFDLMGPKRSHENVGRVLSRLNNGVVRTVVILRR